MLVSTAIRSLSTSTPSQSKITSAGHSVDTRRSSQTVAMHQCCRRRDRGRDARADGSPVGRAGRRRRSAKYRRSHSSPTVPPSTNASPFRQSHVLPTRSRARQRTVPDVVHDAADGVRPDAHRGGQKCGREHVASVSRAARRRFQVVHASVGLETRSGVGASGRLFPRDENRVRGGAHGAGWSSP